MNMDGPLAIAIIRTNTKPIETLMLVSIEAALGLVFDPRYRDIAFAPLTAAALPFLVVLVWITFQKAKLAWAVKREGCSLARGHDEWGEVNESIMREDLARHHAERARSVKRGDRRRTKDRGSETAGGAAALSGSGVRVEGRGHAERRSSGRSR
jgi:hypothetical protein